MAYHYLIGQIIQCEEQEIELYRRIARGAPTQCLRELVAQMAEHERRELEYWKGMLQVCDASPEISEKGPGKDQS